MENDESFTKEKMDYYRAKAVSPETKILIIIKWMESEIYSKLGDKYEQ